MNILLILSLLIGVPYGYTQYSIAKIEKTHPPAGQFKIIDNINTPFSFGYINLLGFMVFVPVTMVMARLGAKAVYKIDKKLLSKIFGAFLIKY